MPKRPRAARFLSLRHSLPVPLEPFPTWINLGFLGLVREIIKLP
jgi:hypothetical protein